MLILEHLKQLEQSQDWAAIRRLSDLLPGDLAGDDLARAYLATSKAFEETATSPEDYRAALAHARAAVASAEHGGLLHVWALHRVAAYLADFGNYAGARRAAADFTAMLPHHDRAQVLLPWVEYALGRAEAGAGRFSSAVRLYDEALKSAPAPLAERITLAKVWALAQAGDVQGALSACPASVEHTRIGSILAARTAILAAAGDWSGAATVARLALPAYAQAPVYDVVEAAELCLILKRAAQVVGHTAEAFRWALHTVAFLSRWNAGLMLVLVPTLRPEGGVYPDAAASHRGAAGHKRAGLRGALG